ncbi:chitin deacetylase [Choanephora cucurbitarum]|nr:chitin deacetylase [Choanephora cucurbitarum]
MHIKTLTISVAIAKLIAFASADVNISTYYQSLESKIDPKNATVPSIDQTTSLDPSVECKDYTPDSSLIAINRSEFPESWSIATSNGRGDSAEFTSLYNSIDWTKAPKISVRKTKSNGDLDDSGYDYDTDPDCWWSASTCTVPKLADVNPDIYKCDEPETWGLTYDDGPNCSHNAFYDYLQQQKLKASMFYIGSNVLDLPYGALRGIADGHHIASHTWSHPYMTTLTNKEVLAELYYTQKAIKLATGITPRYWRPPFGDVDDRVRWVATQLGMTAIIWNYDTDDWAADDGSTPAAVEKTYEQFIEMGTNSTFAESGNIVLTHEIDNITMSLALEFLPKIKASYKNVLDVATCANITHPYFEDFEWTSVINGTDASNTASDATSTVVVATSAADASSTAEATSTTEAASSTGMAAAAQIQQVANNARLNTPSLALVAGFIASLIF